MSYIDSLVPGLIGAALVAAPQLFTKREGAQFIQVRTKLRKIGSVLIGVALIYAFLATVQPRAKLDEPSINMHRQGVDVKDESGWYPATSTYGGFTVAMPIPFNDFSVIAVKEDGSPIETHIVGGLSAEGIKFSATSVKIPQFAPKLADLYGGMKKPNVVVSDPHYEEGSNMSSVRFSMEDDHSGGWIRYVLTPNHLISMIVEYPIDKKEGAKVVAGTFLDSLSVAEKQ